MNAYKQLIITDIQQPFTVHSVKGRRTHIQQRKSWGLSLCTQGQISYILDGKTYTSDPHLGVFLPQGASYTVCPDKDSYSLVVNFYCQGLSPDRIRLLPLSDPHECIRDCERIRELFLFPENRLMIFSVFYELLNKLFLSQPDRQSPLTPALAYLKEHLADPTMNNALLAKQAGISEVYFRKLFAANFHTTPRQYILNLRLQKAKQLLVNTAYSVSAIAEACGFSGLYHFSRTFKEKTGTTPTQYAKNHRRYHI